jgi:glycosyltransferase involved in cell wall biosynthesis
VRILELAEFYDELGGTSEVVENLSRELKRLGHQVEIASNLSARPGFKVERSKEVYWTRVAIPSARPFSLRTPASFIRIALDSRVGELARFIRSFQPDIVNSHVFRWDKLPVIAATCRAADVPLVHMFYETAPLGRGRMGDKALCALRTAAGFAAISDATRRFFSSYLPEARAARVLIGGVDAAAISASTPWRRQRPYLFCACRLNLSHKAVDLLLEAFARLPVELTGFDLVIAGGGPDEATLQATAKRLKLTDRVEFVGLVSRKVLYSLYRGATAFAMPSRGSAEGLGLSFLEAMAAGIPVIGSDSGGPTEIIKDGINGFLIREEDAAGLAQAIAALLSRPEECRRMGAQGKAMVEANWTWRRFAEQYVELFAACLERST